ncbi:MAG TPA: NUDIX hydrolase [Candidatus Saccharimonadales bacterium]|nr:NUDIX hydrolase [Candidatus Saccharimonadales bacterium]
MIDWKLLKSKIVFDNFMQVEERIYELPDGKTKNFYIKITNPSICVLALTEDNKVITVEQFRPGPNTVLNELPGGYIDEGETPEQATARELREETGYAGDIQLVTTCFDDAYVTMERSCFVATNCKRVSNQQLDDSEFLNVKLLDLPDFLKIVRSGRMTDVEVALLGLDYLDLLNES